MLFFWEREGGGGRKKTGWQTAGAMLRCRRGLFLTGPGALCAEGPPEAFFFSMKPLLIHRYLFREMLGPFFVSAVVLAFVFLMAQMPQLADYIVNFRVGIVSVLLLVVYTIPFFLTFVIPMSTMLAVLLAFFRLSSDNEITAMKSGGYGLYRLLPPVLVFCLAATLLTAFMGVSGLVWGRISARNLLKQVARTSADVALKARAFNTRFKDVVIYVNEIDTRKKTLRHVFIEDRQHPGVTGVIVASSGVLESDPERGVWRLILKNGVINHVNMAENAANSFRFETYSLDMDLESALSLAAVNRPKSEEEMSISELLSFIRSRKEHDERYWKAVLQINKKASIPVACLVFGLLAVPLGIVSRDTRKSFGVGLGVFFFLVYYVFLAAGEVMGEAGSRFYPPVVGMWMPDLVLFAVGAFLFARAAADRPVDLAAAVVGAISRVFRRKSRSGEAP